MTLLPTEKDNISQWDGSQPGFYEIWFIIVVQPTTGRGFWLRYTIHIPEEGRKEPRQANLWFISYDPNDPSQHVHWRQDFPVADLETGKERFSVKIGDAILEHTGAKGVIINPHDQRTATWDLSFESDTRTHHHIPDLLKRYKLAKTMVCSPNCDMRVSGKVTIDDEEYLLADDPGQQTHIWGKKRAHNYLWAHCNAFDSKDMVAEMVAAQIKIGGFVLPFMTSSGFRYKGEEFIFNNLPGAFFHKNDYDYGYWKNIAVQGNYKFETEIRADPRNMIVVEYVDPDGEKAYCSNSILADGTVKVFKREYWGLHWQHLETYHAHKTFSLEWLARKPWLDVPVSIEG